MLASTDGAAIFALLRSSTLERKLASTLEAESGLNDPMAVLLVLGFIAWIQEPGYGLADMAWLLVRQIGIGLAVGAAVGAATIAALRRAPLDTGGLYPVATLAAAALAFGGADTLHGSGFLAVYIAGLALGTAGSRRSGPSRRSIRASRGSRRSCCSCRSGCSCSRATSAASRVQGTVLALVVVFVARPIAVWLATALADYSTRRADDPRRRRAARGGPGRPRDVPGDRRA